MGWLDSSSRLSSLPLACLFADLAATAILHLWTHISLLPTDLQSASIFVF